MVAHAYAELEATPAPDEPRTWLLTGRVGISPTHLYDTQEEADADLAHVLLRAFRRAQALAR